MKTFLILFLFFFLFFISCNTTEDPNTLSGDPKTEFSNVGDTTTAWFDLRDIGLGNKEIVVDVAVVSNNNGIVTSRGKLVVDTAITHKIDTTLGTATLPEEIKKAIREKFIRAFNAKIDSSDKIISRLNSKSNPKLQPKEFKIFITAKVIYRNPLLLSSTVQKLAISMSSKITKATNLFAK